MKILSLNIEKRNHVETIARLIADQDADVVCLMEACRNDLDQLIPEYKYRLFGANFRLVSGEEIGVVVAAKRRIVGEVWYPDGDLSMLIPIEAMGAHRPVLVAVEVDKTRLGAVHFTWTPQMSESEKQKADLERLLNYLGQREMVLVGDFNIPRGNGTYESLAAKYKDNIPIECLTTIDWDLHYAKRAGREKFEAVVDYVWSTPKYCISKVKLISGVSDHYGVIFECINE